MSFHSLKEYFKYRFNAYTRHGIHSPFVYRFIDDCLGGSSSLSLEERINHYFSGHIHWREDFSNLPPAIPNQLSVLAIKNIHADAASTKAWDAACSNTDYAISIDMYNIGLLITNPDVKEKQHFVLKYPLRK